MAKIKAVQLSKKDFLNRLHKEAQAHGVRVANEWGAPAAAKKLEESFIHNHTPKRGEWSFFVKSDDGEIVEYSTSRSYVPYSPMV